MSATEPLPLRLDPALRKLQYAWGLTVLLFSLAFFGTASLADSWWSGDEARRWMLLSGACLAYFLAILWRNLTANHRPGESRLLPVLGWGNTLTMLRALPMAMVAGFLFSARPEGWYAWLPGILYTLASLPDFIDGYLARRANQVTELGAVLDMNVDSVGVFSATTLAFTYGVVPWWYLPIGLARYLFVAAIRLREKRGRPVYDLPYSHRRRGFAALKMGFMFVMLLPLFSPPATYLGALAFGLPFAAGFLWDWGLVSGQIGPQHYRRLNPLRKPVLEFAPVLLRAAAVALVWPQIGRHLNTPGLAALASAELAVTLLLAVGIAPRLAAIAAVCLIGANQNLVSLDALQSALIFVYIAMIYLGSGRFSVWPFEEWLIYNRLGDADAA